MSRGAARGWEEQHSPATTGGPGARTLATTRPEAVAGTTNVVSLPGLHTG